ncbi:glycosyltransferase [Desulfococcaceae bacterium HSG9]|nr:glycosyltransferase [Desulfococcaceae bacterium HSG9]
MNKSPKFSIVTPSYNQATFISETIESVISQEGKFEIEYFVMDGGSTDDSVQIIKNYTDRLEKGDWQVKCDGIKMSWVSEKDRGQVDALKKGFKQAKGDIYCWLNSDDIFVDENVFQKVVNYFEADPDLGLLTADGPFITKDGLETGIHHVDQINFKELLFLDYHILQPSTFFRQNIYKNQYLNERYICAFDSDFFIHIISDGVKYKKTDDRFGAFRFYPENKTASLNKRRYLEAIQISLTYSKNIYFILIGIVYRFFEVILKPRYFGKVMIFNQIFTIIQRISYKLITGKPER